MKAVAKQHGPVLQVGFHRIPRFQRRCGAIMARVLCDLRLPTAKHPIPDHQRAAEVLVDVNRVLGMVDTMA
ncbi:hypothetical protein PsW74_05002 [Pseudovibrio sp. W74]|nr:hypothetical protein PsW74_05002 [Pseudovibrio sp. W74]